MSADKYPSIFSRQMETIVYIFSNFQNCARCEKDLKDNKHNSLHLGRKYARIMSADRYPNIFSRQMQAIVQYHSCGQTAKEVRDTVETLSFSN